MITDTNIHPCFAKKKISRVLRICESLFSLQLIAFENWWITLKNPLNLQNA